MKAIYISDGGVSFTSDKPMPELSDERNVLVRVHYAGICRTDLAVAADHIEHADGVILGHEFCGTIEAFYGGGDRLGDWQTGMAVSCNPMAVGNRRDRCEEMLGVGYDGAFAEYVVVPDRALVPLSDGLLNPLGAMLEPVTAAMAPVRYVSGRERICVFGPSRIARLTEQIARSIGVRNVERATDVTELCPGRYDCIIETEPNYIDLLADVIRHGGLLIVKSRSFIPTPVVSNTIAMKELTIQGARYGDFIEASRILSAVSRGEIADFDIADIFGPCYHLEQYEQAFRQASADNSRKIFFRICAE
ncbi:MAG: alcohol dehydrogenase catalytic domain-containing protein [Clostridium sp.]|nr:alcohol dehydrogenase catalytic domain-containing protein [Clostridium sp.]